MLRAIRDLLITNMKWFVLAFTFGLMVLPTFPQSDGLGTAIMDQANGTNNHQSTYGGQGGQVVGTTDQPYYSAGDVSQQVVKEVVNGISSTLESLSNNKALAGAGEVIMTFLLIIMFTWSMLKSMMGNGFNQFIEEMIMLFGVWGIAYAVLHAGGISGIVSFINGIASSFGGADMSTLSGALGATVESGFRTLSNILSMPSGNTSFSFWDGIGAAVGLVVVFIVQLLAKLLCSLLVALAICIYAAHIISAFAGIILATALAPVMVPFLLVPQLSFIFDGWLRFLIVACLMKAVGAFYLSLTDRMMQTMTEIASKVFVRPETEALSMVSANYMVYVSIVILAGLSAFLMSTVPQVAQGLISGSAVSTGFGGLRSITGGPGMGMVNRMSRLDSKPKSPAPGSPSSSRNSGGGSGGGGGSAGNGRQNSGGGRSSSGGGNGGTVTP